MRAADEPTTGRPSPHRIPEAEFPERRQRAARTAREAGFDGLLVVGRSSGSLDALANVFWLTRHYFVPPLVPPTGPWHAYGHDIVAIDGDGRAGLATCGITDPPVIDDVRLGLDVETHAVELIRDLGLGSGRLGLVGSEILPWTLARRLAAEFPDLRLEPADLLMARARLTLSAAECDMVRQSVAAGSAMLAAAFDVAVPGATDGDLVAAAWSVAARTERNQHWNLILASGPIAGEYAAGSLPSWDPLRPYEAGDLIHPDCYGYVDGYMYDVQRSVVVGREPDRRQRWLIEGSWDHAQTLGHALRDGITPREVHEIGVRFMRERGYDARLENAPEWQAGGHFGHGYASGFDWPWLGVTAPLPDEPLVAPFAVTIELSWQEAGVGAAWVEDDWLVLPDGAENLSAALPRSPAPRA